MALPIPSPVSNSLPEVRPRDESLLELSALESLESILNEIPILSTQREVVLRDVPDKLVSDGLLQVKTSEQTWELWLEVKSEAPPRRVREVAPYLHTLALKRNALTYPVLAAPWLSPESRKLCEEAGIGYLDLAGNCRLSFGTVYIERTGFNAPKAQKRDLKSLFGSKSTRILRLLLSNPQKAWKINDIVELADVSLGQASNVRKTLLAQEWAIETKGGIQLKEAQKLLESWAAVYKPPKHKRHQFYTLLHGNTLEDALKNIMTNPPSIALAHQSAAQYWAAYLRSPSTHLYALNVQSIADFAKPVDKGGNLIVDVIEDAGYFLDLRKVKDDFWATSPVQTYLDLQYGGERNREAAQHLLKTIILPQWDKA